MSATNPLLHTLEGLDEQLITPALLFDQSAIQNNIRAVLSRLKDPSQWRPHLKTVKQSRIVNLLLDDGLRYFKVATPRELALVLETSAQRNLLEETDIWLSYPLYGGALELTIELGKSYPSAEICLLADSPSHEEKLSERLVSESDVRFKVVLDVNLGMNRTGQTPSLWAEAIRSGWQPRLPLVGLHGYDGHHRWNERELGHRSYDQLCELATLVTEQFERNRSSSPSFTLVTSGTHSYHHALSHSGLAAGPWDHQISPGTVILSDLRSHEAANDLGLQQAAYVASRVVSKSADHLTLDAGSKGIAPDIAAPNCRIENWTHIHPMRPSEEHLPCKVEPGSTVPDAGTLLLLTPAHVCTTVNLYQRALWFADGRYLGNYPIEGSGRDLILS